MPSRTLPFLLAAAMTLIAAGPSRAAGDNPHTTPVPTSAASQTKAQTAPAKRVDINSASRAELKTLPGIGDAEAERIIAARPYPSKAKLGAEKVIPDQTYQAIRDMIVAAQPSAPNSKTDAKAHTKP